MNLGKFFLLVVWFLFLIWASAQYALTCNCDLFQHPFSPRVMYMCIQDNCSEQMCGEDMMCETDRCDGLCGPGVIRFCVDPGWCGNPSVMGCYENWCI
jgi:hypothetical protein